MSEQPMAVGEHRRVPQAATTRLAELGHLSNVLKTVHGGQLDEEE
jgi:hypothetical protein